MSRPGGGRAHRVVRGLRISTVVLLAGLSLLPIGGWLNISFQRALSFRAVGWWIGALTISLAVAALMIFLRDDDVAAFAKRSIDALVREWERHPIAGTAVISCMATTLYLVTAWTVFDARPLLIDEIVQVIQARIFVSGRLWLPLDAHPEFRSIMHMVEQDGRWYGQFPPGGPAMLALGELVRAPWLVNPVCGGVSVAAFATALRWNGARPGVALGATIAFGFAPFVVFQSASHMNHVTSLMWLLIATAALVRATRGDTDRALAGFVCGVCLGLAATIRPLDAAAWALPAGAWLGWRAVRRGHWGAFLLSGIGVALPMGLMMLVNAKTTGGPFTFGYTVLWGQSHGLGFHESPWGESHTVVRGLALTAAYLNRLNEYLFEVPVPSLIAVLATLALARKTDALERYLYTSGGLAIAAYFAYWHDGFYLGPRFMFPLAPVAALLVAQLPGVVAARWQNVLAVRAVAASYVSAVVLGLIFVLPWRIGSYKSGFQSMRWDYDAIAAKAGATGGVILVRESWGAQVIARLWALGVSRSFAEVLYRHVDTCGLDDMASRLEASDVRGAAAENRFRPMLADSARIVESSLSPDATERMLPGSAYTLECIQRIQEDRGGYAHYAPALLARNSATRWLHDYHARDTLVVARDDTAPLWLLRREAGADTLTPVLVRLNRDSLRTAWSEASTRAKSAGVSRD